MMTVYIAPPYLQFLIADRRDRENPILSEPIEIVTNGSCICVPCQYQGDGDTELVVGSYDEVPKDGIRAFEGELPTRDRKLIFYDIEGTEWLAYPVKQFSSRLDIWTDGAEFPARVVVGIR
jgi:hypothetical protein